MPIQGHDFYPNIPVFYDFGQLMDPAHYAPLPNDWIIGVADIIDSTRAIAEQRYKTVNMAGAAVIAAITNALEGREFPFVFGGDGASFAISPDDLDRARDALAATATWVKADLDLSMRVALVPVADIRAQGLDVRVARFAPSKNVAYAMFAGGGLGWAETAMKRGDYAVTPAPGGSYPDLTGLSCRFEEMPSAHGLILSVLIVPRPSDDSSAFRRVIEDIIALVERSPDAARPVPARGPGIAWPPQGMELEVRAGRGARSRAWFRLWVMTRTLFGYVLIRFGISCAGFVPQLYVRQLVENSDFRKYDDGLRMVLDCTPELERELAQRLSQAASEGAIRYGLHRQDAAMMTCFTPSALRSDHVHFIDGARGGYASAATALKAMPA